MLCNELLRLGKALLLRHNKRMDVYDFDKTLYQGDSTLHFTRYCALRHPRVLTTLPRTAQAALKWRNGTLSITDFKRALYRYLACVPHIEEELTKFWKTHESRITGPCNAKPGDLVISASPEFLLRDICERRQWRLIASLVDPSTGKVLGPNCSKDQKVVRFKEEFPHAHIDNFYSDSLNDTPLACLADNAFLVKGNTVSPWPE